MNRRYLGAAAVFGTAVALLAGLAGLFVASVDPFLLILLAGSLYATAVLLDLLPPGRPNTGDPDPAAAHRRRAGPADDSGQARDPVQLASVVALGGIAILTAAVTLLGAWREGGDELALARQRLGGEETETSAAVAAQSSNGQQLPGTASEPTPTPSPQPTATPTADVPATPTIPDSPFAHCTHLEADNYTCGDQPWRVICGPAGYFFDPEGAVPSPIPEEWEGWHETTLTERLEYIHAACD